jgi:hypothetical protein
MTAGGPPGRVATHLVTIAARTLQATHRSRYQQEFTAELYGMPRSHQIRHALQVLALAWALRSALDRSSAPALGEAMQQPRNPLACRANLWHTWRTFKTDDGGRYRACAKCGKDLPDNYPGTYISM